MIATVKRLGSHLTALAVAPLLSCGPPCPEPVVPDLTALWAEMESCVWTEWRETRDALYAERTNVSIFSTSPGARATSHWEDMQRERTTTSVRLLLHETGQASSLNILRRELVRLGLVSDTLPFVDAFRNPDTPCPGSQDIDK